MCGYHAASALLTFRALLVATQNGNAYFAKDLAIARDFERREGYGDGVIAVQIPRRDYDLFWAQYEVRYASALGGTELIIPRSVVGGLNDGPIFWPT